MQRLYGFWSDIKLSQPYYSFTQGVVYKNSNSISSWTSVS